MTCQCNAVQQRTRKLFSPSQKDFAWSLAIHSSARTLATSQRMPSATTALAATATKPMDFPSSIVQAGYVLKYSFLHVGLAKRPLNILSTALSRQQDGKNLDSVDHKSHMAYPASGKYNDGPCPSSHPKQMISLFYEVLYDTNQFANEWHGNTQPFVFAQGDPTGYGFHGDFVNGWDVDILQQVVDTCDNLADHGDLATCAVIANQLYTEKEQNRCRLESTTNEQVTGLLDSLPGCNPVFAGPGRAPTNSVCNEQPASSKASPTSRSRSYKDITSSKKRAYIGCASDSTDNDSRTFSDKTTIYSADAAREMTVEYCADFCSGYTYAGVEYGTQ